MSLLTIAVGLIALQLFRAKREQKLRLAQVLFVLPTGALFLATGGDDMPILALMQSKEGSEATACTSSFCASDWCTVPGNRWR